MNIDEKLDRIPPQALNMEKSVLGSLLVQPNLIDDVRPILKSPEYFYSDNHAKIYSVMLELNDRDTPIDLFTVSEVMEGDETEETIGESFYLSTLTDMVVSSSNVVAHAMIIVDKYILRQFIRVGYELWDGGYSKSINTGLFLLEKLHDEIDTISSGGVVSKEFRENLDLSYKQLEKRKDLFAKGETTGIKTGLADLDKITNGWQNGELIIEAGRPGMGKTAMMLAHAKAAAKQGKKVRVYSLEMTVLSLTDRIILSECGIEADRYKSGNLTDGDMESVRIAIVKLNKLGIYIDDYPIRTIQSIRSDAKAWNRKGLCDIIFIDYLQLTEPVDGKSRSLNEKTTEISRQAKMTAKDLNIPVVLLSQLNRAVETRGGSKKPQLSDLRDSGSIEQDADLVLFVYRAAYYDFEFVNIKGEEIPSKGIGELSVAKQRNGQTGSILFKHNESLSNIYDYDFEEIKNLPF